MAKQKHKRMRPYLEAGAFLLLLYVIWRQWPTVSSAWDTITDAKLTYIALAFGVAWGNFLWSGLGYHLLAPTLKFRQICLAHLAASGPGRVIPGGAGHMSFGILFLQKHGFTLQRSVVIASANNIMGFLVNTIVLLIIFLSRPTLVQAVHVSKSASLRLAAIVLALTFFLYLFALSRKGKIALAKVTKEIRTLTKLFRRRPSTLWALVATMLATIATNSTVLLLSANAVGLHIQFSEAVIVMSLGVAVGGLLPTPGGVGGVEAGIVAALVLLGYDTATATAAALVFRGATYLQPFLPGCLAYVYLRKRALL